MVADRDKVVVRAGPGWTVYTSSGCAWIKFNSKPDEGVLAKLRRVGVWDSGEKAWRAHPDSVAELLRVADAAETWESVGEEAPSWFDDADYPPFH